jgi:hypothetical protein
MLAELPQVLNQYDALRNVVDPHERMYRFMLLSTNTKLFSYSHLCSALGLNMIQTPIVPQLQAVGGINQVMPGTTLMQQDTTDMSFRIHEPVDICGQTISKEGTSFFATAATHAACVQ